MKNYEYVFDHKTYIIKKVYHDEKKNYMVESMALFRIYEELEKLREENVDLETKLAEKEKEIEELKCKIVDFCENIDERNKIYNQDKISFAVEQLNTLKSQIIAKRRLYKGKFSEFSNGINDALFDVQEDIDNQIKEIKGDD